MNFWDILFWIKVNLPQSFLNLSRSLKKIFLCKLNFKINFYTFLSKSVSWVSSSWIVYTELMLHFFWSPLFIFENLYSSYFMEGFQMPAIFWIFLKFWKWGKWIKVKDPRNLLIFLIPKGPKVDLYLCFNQEIDWQELVVSQEHNHPYVAPVRYFAFGILQLNTLGPLVPNHLIFDLICAGVIKFNVTDYQQSKWLLIYVGRVENTRWGFAT